MSRMYPALAAVEGGPYKGAAGRLFDLNLMSATSSGGNRFHDTRS